MERVMNPHDKFFKDVFTRKEALEEFLSRYLPGPVPALIDPSTLEYSKDSFIDEEMKEYRSDLLVQVRLRSGGAVFVYILFEHKSYPEPEIAYDLLVYMIRIWRRPPRELPAGKRPPIIPLVFYHGTGGWKIARSFSSLIDCHEALLKFVPQFEYLVWDVSSTPDEELKAGALLQVALLLFKYIFRDDLRDRLPDIFSLLGELAGKGTGMEFIETVIRYVLSVAPETRLRREELFRTIHKALTATGDEMMITIADRIREEGRLEGRGEGALATAREDVLDVLEARFETVPQSIMRMLDSMDNPTVLKALLKRAARADTIEHFRQNMDAILNG